MKLEDFCVVHKAKAGLEKVICYEIFSVEKLEDYFKQCNYKPVILAEKLNIHYQSMRKLLQDSGLWKYVRTKNGRGCGINRKRMRATNRDGYPYSENPDSFIIKDGRSRRKMKHTEVMGNQLDRELTKKERVHHINGDKSDFRLENLALVTVSSHMYAHKSLELLGMELVKVGIIIYNKDTNLYEFSEAAKEIFKEQFPAIAEAKEWK